MAAGNSLGGRVALRLAEDGHLGLAGVVPIAPAGLDIARWLTLVEHNPLLAGLLTLPTPLPEGVVRAVVGQVYTPLAFADATSVPPGVVAAFTAHHRDRETVARYLASAFAAAA